MVKLVISFLPFMLIFFSFLSCTDAEKKYNELEYLRGQLEKKDSTIYKLSEEIINIKESLDFDDEISYDELQDNLSECESAFDEIEDIAMDIQNNVEHDEYNIYSKIDSITNALATEYPDN